VAIRSYDVGAISDDETNDRAPAPVIDTLSPLPRWTRFVFVTRNVRDVGEAEADSSIRTG